MLIDNCIAEKEEELKPTQAWTCKWCKTDNPETKLFCQQCFKAFKYSAPNYDAPRITYDLACRAVTICLRFTYASTSFQDPKDMMKELKGYKDKDLSDPHIFANVDEILWNACAHLDMKFCGNDITNMLNQSELIEECIEAEEKSHESFLKQKEKSIKNMYEDPDTFEVKGSKKGTTYLVNLEKRLCTCPGFKYQNDCKHVNMEKKPKKKK
jgi:hypothetical protein